MGSKGGNKMDEKIDLIVNIPKLGDLNELSKTLEKIKKSQNLETLKDEYQGIIKFGKENITNSANDILIENFKKIKSELIKQIGIIADQGMERINIEKGKQFTSKESETLFTKGTRVSHPVWGKGTLGEKQGQNFKVVFDKGSIQIMSQSGIANANPSVPTNKIGVFKKDTNSVVSANKNKEPINTTTNTKSKFKNLNAIVENIDDIAQIPIQIMGKSSHKLTKFVKEFVIFLNELPSTDVLGKTIGSLYDKFYTENKTKIENKKTNEKLKFTEKQTEIATASNNRVIEIEKERKRRIDEERKKNPNFNEYNDQDILTKKRFFDAQEKVKEKEKKLEEIRNKKEKTGKDFSEMSQLSDYINKNKKYNRYTEKEYYDKKEDTEKTYNIRKPYYDKVDKINNQADIKIAKEKQRVKKRVYKYNPDMFKNNSNKITLNDELNELEQQNEIAQEVNSQYETQKKIRQKKEKLIKDLKVKPLEIEFDSENHEYREVIGRDKNGKAKLAKNTLPTITGIAGAISSGSDMQKFMSRGNNALKDPKNSQKSEEEILNEVYSKDEIKRYKNTTNAATRGTTIHKAIELLESGVVKDVNELVKFFDKLNANAKSESEKIFDYNEDGKFKHQKKIEDYFEIKDKLGLKGTNLSEQPLGAQIGDFKFAGTLDELFTGGHLADLKTGAVNPQTMTVQANLLKLVLEANKSKLAIQGKDSNVNSMGVIHLPNSKTQKASYTGIGDATVEEVQKWIAAALKGEKIDIEDLLQYKIEKQSFGGGTGKNAIEQGESIAIMGRFLGNWANDYNKADMTINKKTFTEDDRKAILDDTTLTEKEKKSKIAKYSTKEEKEKAAIEKKYILDTIEKAYSNSDGELQDEFSKKIFASEEFMDKYSNAPKRKLFGDLKEQMAYAEPVAFEYGIDETKSMPKLDPDERVKKYKIEDRQSKELNTSDSIEKLKKIDTYFNTLLHSIDDIIKTDPQKALGILKEAMSGIKEVAYPEEIKEDMLSDIVSSSELPAVGATAKYLSDKEEKRETNTDVSKEEEILNARENSLNEEEKEKYNSKIEEYRQRVFKKTQALKNGSSPLEIENINKFQDSFEDQSSLLGKNDKSVEDDSNQVFHRVAKLLTASDTIEKAAEEWGNKLGISKDKALRQILNDENVKADYDLSKAAKKAFKKGGGFKNIDGAMNAMFGISGKEIEEIALQYDTTDNNYFEENLKDQMTKDSESKMSKKQKWQRGNSFLMSTIPFGNSVITPLSPDKVLDNIKDKLIDIENQKKKISNSPLLSDEQKEKSINNLIAIEKKLKNARYSIEMQHYTNPESKPQQISEQGMLYYDTETSGVDEKARPVTFGMYNTKTKESTEKYLDYGDEKTNIQNLIKAMNIKDNNGGLIESSSLLRKSFSIEDGFDLTNIEKNNALLPKELKSKIMEVFKKNKITKTQLFNLIKAQGLELGGFNNNDFDYKMMSRFFSHNDKTGKGKEQFDSLFPNQNAVDIRQLAWKQVAPNLKNNPFIKGMKLQDLRKLFFGKEDEDAHGAASDAKTTADIAEYVNNGLLKSIGEVSHSIAGRDGKKVTYGSNSNFSKIFQKIMQAMQENNITTDIGSDKIMELYNSQSTTPEVAKGVKNEKDTFQSENPIIKEHIEEMTEARNVELLKADAAGKLVGALNKEENAIEDTTGSMSELNKEELKGIELTKEQKKNYETLIKARARALANGDTKTADRMLKNFQEQFKDIIKINSNFEKAFKEQSNIQSKKFKESDNKKNNNKLNEEEINNLLKERISLLEKIANINKQLKTNSLNAIEAQEAGKNKIAFQSEIDNINKKLNSEGYSEEDISNMSKGLTSKFRLKRGSSLLGRKFDNLNIANLKNKYIPNLNEESNEQQTITNVTNKGKGFSEAEKFERNLKKIQVLEAKQAIEQSYGSDLNERDQEGLDALRKIANRRKNKLASTEQGREAIESVYKNLSTSYKKTLSDEQKVKLFENSTKKELKLQEELAILRVKLNNAKAKNDKDAIKTLEKDVKFKEEILTEVIAEQKSISSDDNIGEKFKQKIAGAMARRDQSNIWNTAEGRYKAEKAVAESENLTSQKVSKQGISALNKYTTTYNTAERDLAGLQRQQQDTNLTKYQTRALEEAVRLKQQYIEKLRQEQVLVTENGIAIYRNGQLVESINLTEEERLNVLKQQELAQSKQSAALAKIQTTKLKSEGFFGQVMTGFKASLRNLTDYSMAYTIIGQIKMGFQQTIQVAKELDKSLVNLQIVTGGTRKETMALLGSYNQLANEMGRTTQEVADASNDFLRAGYRGQEATDLTKASMSLSTLGMLDSAEATNYLISSLKGWKLESKDAMNVVDKLTKVDMEAALSAGDLALAMSRANASAQQAGKHKCARTYSNIWVVLKQLEIT